MSFSDSDNRSSNAAEFTVGEIAQAVKRTVEDRFGYVRVRGEVSGYRGPHSSGHAYFSLKDERARLDAVVWRGVFSKLKFKPEEGMEVIATGKLTTFPGSSKYQIVIERIEPAGVGALMALLEERRKKLAAEGLFDDTRKQPLPYLPRVIGVVTSPTGAVIQDILHRLRDRFPTHVLVWPVRVQGDTSGAEITRAINGFNKIDGSSIPRPDLLIVARGGGSLEDLWSFNDEDVVRAVAASRIPIISAVGHETDWTLIDHVADRRAPTPTGAAEMAVPVLHELVSTVDVLGLRNNQGIHRQLDKQRNALRGLSRAMPSLDAILGLPRQRFDAVALRLRSALIANTSAHRTRLVAARSQMRPGILANRVGRAADKKHQLDRQLTSNLARIIERKRENWRRAGALRPQLLARPVKLGRNNLQQRSARMDQAFVTQTTRARQRLDAQAQVLRLVSYQSVLQRGFALVRDEAGQPIRAAASTSSGQNVALEFTDGRVGAVIDGDASDMPKSQATPVATKVAKPKPAPKKPAIDQGTLF
ncbi:MAG: exodeoxyribonuclease VII large subunit [Hyphomicrobiales bacterium]|nr:MAG: exodeoxyribonuclease VII large subunit [Hyphomicrobiales bacterium]